MIIKVLKCRGDKILSLRPHAPQTLITIYYNIFIISIL